LQITQYLKAAMLAVSQVPEPVIQECPVAMPSSSRQHFIIRLVKPLFKILEMAMGLGYSHIPLTGMVIA
jgi:hypothetical protein